MAHLDAPLAADMIISGADIVTMDPECRVIRDGAIAVAGGAIAWVGPPAEVDMHATDGERLDARGRIALPGLIDTHVYTAQQLLRGILSELAQRRHLRLPIWRNYLIPFESVLGEEAPAIAHRG